MRDSEWVNRTEVQRRWGIGRTRIERLRKTAEIRAKQLDPGKSEWLHSVEDLVALHGPGQEGGESIEERLAAELEATKEELAATQAKLTPISQQNENRATQIDELKNEIVGLRADLAAQTKKQTEVVAEIQAAHTQELDRSDERHEAELARAAAAAEERRISEVAAAASMGWGARRAARKAAKALNK